MQHFCLNFNVNRFLICVDVIDFGRNRSGFLQMSVRFSSCKVVLSDSVQNRLPFMAWAILVLSRGLLLAFKTLSQLSKHRGVVSHDIGVRASSKSVHVLQVRFDTPKTCLQMLI